MKKFFIGVLIVVCLSCVGFAVACGSKVPEYYTLTFEKTDGVTFNCDVPNGYEVKQGYTVSFSLEYSEIVIPESISAAVVKANGAELKADGDGKYSFSITSDTTVTVDGIAVLNRYDVTFTKGDNRIDYLSGDGESVYEEEGFTVIAGEQVSFKIDVSSYYGADPAYEVLANTRILKPENGVYTFTVTEKTNITVTGLEYEDPFYLRPNGGDGSEDNPYKISRPIDLFVLADIVSGASIYYNSVYSAYYELTDDIDMKGEQLYIIGYSDQYCFGGHFNGNGHTISNYYIDDTVLDQSVFTEEFMPYLGLFGYCSATTGSAVEIYNLNLENFTIYVNASRFDSAFSVGGLVGMGFGVVITGCSVSGTITVDADNDQFGYAGGIAGNLYSAYASESLWYYSIVSSCSSDVDISCQSGHVYAAGGIVGILSSTQERTPSLILNCYSTGSVYGAMYAGGIVGRLSSYGSVQSCYSTGSVSARNTIGLIAGGDEIAYAYAGGIAGYADSDSVIADSFSLSSTYAYSAANASGKNFAYSGGIVGGKDVSGAEDATLYIHSQPALVVNCISILYSSDINDAYIKEGLGWNEADWVFNGKDLPTINKTATEKRFTVTISYGNNYINGSNYADLQINSLYLPVSYWYMFSENMPEFVGSDDGLRSYGYYFDRELKNKVPYGFVPMNDITLYAGFADYGEVAGEYYVAGSGSIKLVLDADGTLTYSDGGLNCVSFYTYDGNEIILRDTFISVALNGDTYYRSFKATLSDDGVLSIFDNTYYTSAPLTAVKTAATVKYGVYFDANGGVYEFNKDGTGSVTADGRTQTFTYVVDGTTVRLSTGNGAINASGYFTQYRTQTLTPADDYYGYWVSSASSHRIYFFNGRGGWTYKNVGYDDNGNEVNVTAPASGNYTVSGSWISLGSGVNAGFTAEGFLTIDGVNFYKQGSYTGTWNYFNNDCPAEITLNGIGKDGVGTGIVNYGATGVYEINYSVVSGGVIEMYYGDLLIGRLGYSQTENILYGTLYNATLSQYVNNASLYLYDSFRGVWISEIIERIEFNGLGNYSVKGNDQHMAVAGAITVNGTLAGNYTLENSTLKGSFVYEDVLYNIEYNEKTNLINVSYAGGSFTFEGLDKWYNIQLTDGNKVYSFDGRGNLSSGGTMTVTDASGNTATYNYKNSGTGMTTSAGNITVSGGYYKLGSATLSVNNPFTGKWLIVGSDDSNPYLEIGTVNSEFKASGTVFGKAVTFTYNSDENYMTFEDGTTMYINVLTTDGFVELGVSSVASTLYGYTVCVSEDSYDEYKGTYIGDDGSFIVFDGLGNGKFISGTAVHYDNDGIVDTYTYSFNDFGVPVLIGSVTAGLFVPVELGGDDEKTVYTSQTSSEEYVFTMPDIMYLVKAYGIKQGEYILETDKSVSYGFDGLGTVYCSDGSEYAYEVIIDDDVRMECYLTLTDSQGKIYYAVLNYGGEDMTLSIDLKLVTAYGVIIKDNVLSANKNAKFSFDGENILLENEALYTYKITGFDKVNKVFVLSLTDNDGSVRTAVLNYGVSDKTLVDLYNVTAYGAKVQDGEVVADKSISYLFSSEKITCSDGTEYLYEVESYASGVFTLTITRDDTKYTATLNYGLTDKTMTITAKIEDNSQN